MMDSAARKESRPTRALRALRALRKCCSTQARSTTASIATRPQLTCTCPGERVCGGSSTFASHKGAAKLQRCLSDCRGRARAHREETQDGAAAPEHRHAGHCHDPGDNGEADRQKREQTQNPRAPRTGTRVRARHVALVLAGQCCRLASTAKTSRFPPSAGEPSTRAACWSEGPRALKSKEPLRQPLQAPALASSSLELSSRELAKLHGNALPCLCPSSQTAARLHAAAACRQESRSLSRWPRCWPRLRVCSSKASRGRGRVRERPAVSAARILTRQQRLDRPDPSRPACRGWCAAWSLAVA